MMRSTPVARRPIVLVVQILFALASPLAHATILGVDGPAIYSINETTGASVLLTSNSSPTGAVAMAKNSAGTIYVAGDNGGGSGALKLYTVDPATGIATSGATVGLASVTVAGFAFSSADVLYAISVPTGGALPYSLVTVNTTTGVVSGVGLLNGAIRALEFSPGGVLYGWEPGALGRGLVTINPATAAITDVNAAVGDAGTNIETLAFSSAGVLYGARSSLYVIDLVTGTPTLVAAFSPATTIFGMEFFGAAPPAGPVVSLTPPSLGFGNQLVGTTSGSQALTLQNVGTGVLSIASIAASSDFAQTNNCGATVAASASCTINVSFTPTTTGFRSGSLSVTSDAPGSPHTSTLGGTGVDVAPPPPPADPSAPIPTLSQWVLIALGILVAYFGGVRLRDERRRSR